VPYLLWRVGAPRNAVLLSNGATRQLCRTQRYAAAEVALCDTYH
jgi:hypothetical protein